MNTRKILKKKPIVAVVKIAIRFTSSENACFFPKGKAFITIAEITAMSITCMRKLTMLNIQKYVSKIIATETKSKLRIFFIFIKIYLFRFFLELALVDALFFSFPFFSGFVSLSVLDPISALGLVSSSR